MRRFLTTLLGAVALVGAVAFWVNETQPDWYVRARYPLAYRSIIESHGRTYDLDPALVAAVIYTESRFKPEVRSPAGAVGLMQLLPETGVAIATRTGGGRFVPSDLLDPEINIRYGCWYLANLRRKYGSRPDALELALAAYNAGQTNVDRWVAATPAGQAVPIRFAETRAYVTRVERLRDRYARAYGL